MKKLRLNKIFHWLYAFLMFAPIFVFFYFFITYAFQGYYVEDIFTTILENVFAYTFTAESSGLGLAGTIRDMFTYIGIDILSIDVDSTGTLAALALNLCSYWVIVSVIYLIFDVVMYPINLFHRWIDEGGI